MSMFEELVAAVGKIEVHESITDMAAKCDRVPCAEEVVRVVLKTMRDISREHENAMEPVNEAQSRAVIWARGIDHILNGGE